MILGASILQSHISSAAADEMSDTQIRTEIVLGGNRSLLGRNPGVFGFLGLLSRFGGRIFH